ncbi:hypothetical protein Tco_1275428 [Tanacetum coccineum]
MFAGEIPTSLFKIRTLKDHSCQYRKYLPKYCAAILKIGTKRAESYGSRSSGFGKLQFARIWGFSTSLVPSVDWWLFLLTGFSHLLHLLSDVVSGCYNYCLVVCTTVGWCLLVISVVGADIALFALSILAVSPALLNYGALSILVVSLAICSSSIVEGRVPSRTWAAQMKSPEADSATQLVEYGSSEGTLF